MRDGNDGIHGNGGNVVSVTYRFQKSWKSSNPTLFANHTSSVTAMRAYLDERAFWVKPFRQSGSAERRVVREPVT